MCTFVDSTEIRRMKYFPLIILFCVSTIFAQAQQKLPKNKEDIKLLYSSEIIGGVFLHSRGTIGANFRYAQIITAKFKRFYSAEITDFKHPKEKRITNAGASDAKSFVYGKLNSMVNLRLNMGHQHVIYSKELKGGVQVNYSYALGPSFAFVKPVFLEVYAPGSGGAGNPNVKIEQYDPEKHFLGNILGRAFFTHGISKMSVIPGAHAKFAFNFEFAPEDDRVKALEVGTVLDVYPKAPEIMHNVTNNAYWLTFYINFIFGKKNI